MQLIDKIRNNLNAPLPGPDAQYQMAPDGRRAYAHLINDYTEAAVLSLIFPRAESWHMVFIERSGHEKDKHRSQIAFPGGKVEPEDANFIDAALREAEEEIGADPTKIEILGELTPLKIPVSKFEVFPVLGFNHSEPKFIPQASEVERIIEVPLDQIINPNNRIRKEIQLPSGLVLPEVPVFRFEQDIIWGATSMMLNEIIEILT